MPNNKAYFLNDFLNILNRIRLFFQSYKTPNTHAKTSIENVKNSILEKIGETYKSQNDSNSIISALTQLSTWLFYKGDELIRDRNISKKERQPIINFINEQRTEIEKTVTQLSNSKDNQINFSWSFFERNDNAVPALTKTNKLASLKNEEEKLSNPSKDYLDFKEVLRSTFINIDKTLYSTHPSSFDLEKMKDDLSDARSRATKINLPPKELKIIESLILFKYQEIQRFEKNESNNNDSPKMKS